MARLNKKGGTVTEDVGRLLVVMRVSWRREEVSAWEKSFPCCLDGRLPKDHFPLGQQPWKESCTGRTCWVEGPWAPPWTWGVVSSTLALRTQAQGRVPHLWVEQQTMTFKLIGVFLSLEAIAKWFNNFKFYSMGKHFVLCSTEFFAVILWGTLLCELRGQKDGCTFLMQGLGEWMQRLGGWGCH